MRLSLRFWQRFLALLNRRSFNRRQRRAGRSRLLLRRRDSVVRQARFDVLEKRVVMNADPVGVNDERVMSLNSTEVISKNWMTSNDTDADIGDSLTVSAFDAFTQQGVAVSFNEAGEFSYSAPNGFVGNDSFTYTVRDPNGATSQAKVVFKVTANAAPVIATGTTRSPQFTAVDQDISAAANQGTSVADFIYQNRDLFSDANENTLGIAIVGQGADSTNGQWQYTRDGGTTWYNAGGRSPSAALLLSADSANRIRFQPNPGTFGTKSLTIKLWDGTNGLASGTTTTTSPSGGTTAYSQASIDAKITVRGLAAAVNLTATEDVANPNGWLVSDLLAGAPSGTTGVAVLSTAFVATGSWEYRLTSTGPWLALSVGNPFAGTDEAMEVDAYAAAQFNLNVDGFDPIALDTADPAGNLELLEAVLGVGNVSYNQTVIDDFEQILINFTGALAKQNINWSLSDVQSSGAVQSFTTREGATPTAYAKVLAADATTRIRFTPYSPYNAVNYNGVIPNVLNVRWWDGTNGAANGSFVTNYLLDSSISSTTVPVSRTVAAVNDAPTTPIGSLSTTEDTPVSLYGSDVDGDLLTYTLVTAPTNGTVTVGYGKLTYTPNPNFFGSDSFVYKVSDGQVTTANKSVTVSVTSVNDAPSFQVGANVVVDEDSGAYSAPWATGISKGPSNESSQSLSWIVTNNNNQLFSVQPTLSATGVLTFTPAANKHGTATVTVRLQDGGGTSSGGINTSLTRTFTIDVASVLDPPSAVANWIDVTYGTPRTIAASFLLLNDSNPEGGMLTVALSESNGPIHGSVSFDGTTFIYTPSSTYIGVDSFDYIISDGQNSSTATVYLEVGPLLVTAGNSFQFVTDEDTPLGLRVTRNRVDGLEATHFRLTTNRGTLVVDGQTIDALTNVTAGDAMDGFTYVPTADYSGAAVITVQAGIVINGVFGAIKTFDVTVNPVNDPPSVVAVSTTPTSYSGQTISLANAFTIGDVDSEQIRLTFTTDHGLIRRIDTGEQGTSLSFTTYRSNVASVMQYLRHIAPVDYAGSAGVTATVADLDSNGDPVSSSSNTLDILVRPTVTVSAVPTVNEDAETLDFTVTLSAAFSELVTVYWGRSGSAVSGVDLNGPESGFLQFAAGQTTKTISFPLIDDSLDEDSESVGLVLTSATNAVVVGATAIAMIVDNDAAPTLSGEVAEVTVNENGVVATIKVVLSEPSGKSVSFRWQPADGTAVRPYDWTDGYWEDVYEQIWVDTSHYESVWIPDQWVPQWVENWVNHPYQSAGYYDEYGNYVEGQWVDNYVDEGYWGTVYIPGYYDSQWMTEGHYENGAWIGGHWNDGGYLTINPGQTEVTFTVQILDDLDDEDDETFAVALTDVTNATLVEPSQIVIRIIDNERQHAPELNPEAVPLLAEIVEDAADEENQGTYVAALIASAVADVNDDACGIAVTSADESNGRWEFNLGDGAGWRSFQSGLPEGEVLSVNFALHLAGDAKVRFVANANFNTATADQPMFVFRAWDRSNDSSGVLNGTFADATPNGGNTAYSVLEGLARIPVLPVNDVPTFTLGGNIATPLSGSEFVGLGFLTVVAAGPANESGQSLIVTVTNDNPELFTTAGQPTIDAEGRLKFTTQFVGTARVTVRIQDDGGTALGGKNVTTKFFWVTVTPSSLLAGGGSGGGGETSPTEPPDLADDAYWLSGVTITTSLGAFDWNSDVVPKMNASDVVKVDLSLANYAVPNSDVYIDWGDSSPDAEISNASGPIHREHSYTLNSSGSWPAGRSIEVSYYVDGQIRGRVFIPIGIKYPEPTLTVPTPGNGLEGDVLTLAGTFTVAGPLASNVSVTISSNQPGWLGNSSTQVNSGSFSSQLQFKHSGTYDVTVTLFDGITRVEKTVAITVDDKLLQGFYDPGTDDYYQVEFEHAGGTIKSAWTTLVNGVNPLAEYFTGAFTGTGRVVNSSGTTVSSQNFNGGSTISTTPPANVAPPFLVRVADAYAGESILLSDGRVVLDRAALEIFPNFAGSAGNGGSGSFDYVIVRADWNAYPSFSEEDLMAAADDAQADWLTDTKGTISVAANQSSYRLLLSPKTDGLAEFDEDFVIWIRPPAENGGLPAASWLMMTDSGYGRLYDPLGGGNITLFDSVADVEFGSNNVDTASTGLVRERVFDGQTEVDLYDGKASWTIPFAGDFPVFYQGYSNAIMSTTGLNHDTGSMTDGRFLELLADQSMDRLIFSNGQARTFRRFSGGIGDLNIDDLISIDPNPFVGVTTGSNDGNYRAGYVDRLIPVGFDGADYGFLLLRRDGTSAWYKAVPIGGTSVQPTGQLEETWSAPDSRDIQRASNDDTINETVTWTMTGLDSGRMYQLFTALPPDLPNSTGHYFAGGPTLPELPTVTKGARIAGTGISGQNFDGGTKYSLGWYRPDATGTLELKRLAGDMIAPITVVDTWLFKTPDGSLATLETIPRELQGSDKTEFRLTTDDGLKFEFDGFGLLTSQTTRDGNQIRYSYSGTKDDGSFARLSSVTTQGGFTTEIKYVTAGSAQLASITDAFGRTTTFNGYTVISPAPTEAGSSVDAQSLRIIATVGRRFFDNTAPDTVGHVVDPQVGLFTPFNPLNASAEELRASTGNIGRLTVLGAEEWSASYRAAYDDTVAGELGLFRYQMDRFGLTIAKAAPAVGDQVAGLGDVWKWERDSDGLVKRAYVPAGRGTAPSGEIPSSGFDQAEYNSYDLHGNLLFRTYPDGTTETWTYDGAKYNQITSYTDRTGRKVSYDLLADGKIEKIHVDPDGLDLISEFTYTAATGAIDGLPAGLLLSAKDPTGATVTYAYYDDRETDGVGKFGRIKTKTYTQSSGSGSGGASLTETFDYDSYGNLVSKVDINNVATVFRYDRLGNLLESRVGGTRNATTGELTGGTLIALLTYDAAGSLRSKTSPDADGNPALTTVYEYDVWNRLIKVTEPIAAGQYTTAPMTEFKYSPEGLLLELKTADGLTTTYEYDDRRQKIKETVKGAATGLVKRSGGGSFTETVTEYEYDAAGNLKSVKDPLDRTTYFTYDVDGRLISTKSPDPDGGETGLSEMLVRTEYDAAGRILAEYSPDPAGTGEISKKYVYDDAGRLRRVINPTAAQESGPSIGTFVAYEYYGNGTLKAKRTGAAEIGSVSMDDLDVETGLLDGDFCETVTAFEYDAAGRALSTSIDDLTDALAAKVSSVTYEIVEGTLVETRTVEGNTTTVTYDDQGRIVRIEYPRASTAPDAPPAPVTLREYNAAGRLKQETKTYVGDESGAANLVTQYVYDEAGRLRTTTGNGIERTLTYDKLGRTVEESVKNGNTTTNTYNNRGQLIRTETRDGGAAGALLSFSDFEFDEVGALYRSTVNGVAETTYQYDALDRQTSSQLVYQDGAETLSPISPKTTTYNRAGLVKSQSDGLLLQEFTYDSRGRIVESKETGDGVRISMTKYDDELRQKMVVDPKNNATLSTFDGFGRLVSEKRSSKPDGASSFQDLPGLRKFDYDVVGNLVRYTDLNGRVTEYSYDNLGRKTSEVWVGGDYTANWTYDALGRLASASDAQASYEYSQFDAANRATTTAMSLTPGTAAALSFELRSNYLDVGKQNSDQGISDAPTARSSAAVTLSLNGQTVLTNRIWLDAAGRQLLVEQSTTDGNFERVKFEYQSSSLTKQLTLTRSESKNGVQRNSVVTTITNLHGIGGVADIVAHTQADNPNDFDSLHRIDYSFGDNQRMSGWSDHYSTQNILLDARGLSTTETNTHDGTTETPISYAPDASGNATNNGKVIGPHNRVERDAEYVYQYDNEGNLIYKQALLTSQTTSAGETWDYTYDYRNRLTSAKRTLLNGDVVTNVKLEYDVHDRLIAKHVIKLDGQAPDRWEYVVYDGDNPLARFGAVGNATPALTQRELYGADGALLAWEDVAAGVVYWPLADGEGSTYAVVRGYADGYQDVDRYFYKGTGEFAETANLPAAPTMFAGRQYDVDLNLYFYGGRAYDARQGRFLSETPTAAGSNPYLNPDARKDSSSALLTHAAEMTWGDATLQALNDVSQSMAQYGRPAQFLGGLVQTGVGFGAAFFSGGLFAAGGLAAVASGVDDMYHAISGSETWKSQAAKIVAKEAGASDGVQNALGIAADFAGGLIGGGLGAAKAAKYLGKTDEVSRGFGNADNLSGAVTRSGAGNSDQVSRIYTANWTRADDGSLSLNFSGCFSPDTLVVMAQSAQATSADEGSTQVRLTTAIASVQLGSRVVGDNPRPWEIDTEFGEPDSKSWLLISGTARRSDGAFVDLEILRPSDWALKYGVNAGAQLFVSYEELGLRGKIDIHSVNPAPRIEPGEGHVVIGRFVSREVSNVVQLQLSEGTSIRVTDTHLIWSIDRLDWVPAGELRQDELIDLVDGAARVSDVTAIGYLPAVYNLEVHGQHVYRVAQAGVLVHNTNAGCPGVVAPATTGANAGTQLVSGVRIELRLSRSGFNAAEQAAVEYKYAVANGRIASGLETSQVGSQVPYNSYLSRRFVRDTLQPGTPVRQVRVPDNFQVDEFVSRQFGGRQVPANQWLMPNDNFLNNRLGPLERAATQHLPDGTPIRGWKITWED